MKIRVNEEKMRRLGKRVAISCLIMGIFIAPSCHKHKDIPYIPKGDNDKIYEVGEHMLFEIKRNFGIVGKKGLHGLIAPEGYRVLEYDYDKTDYFHYNDYVYINDEPVDVSDVDKPVTILEEKNDTDILESGEHVIVDIDKSLILLGNLEKFLLYKQNLDILFWIMIMIKMIYLSIKHMCM